MLFWGMIYEKLFKKSNDAILMLNHKGKIIKGNNSATKLLGYSKNELKGKFLNNFTNGDEIREINEKQHLEIPIKIGRKKL